MAYSGPSYTSKLKAVASDVRKHLLHANYIPHWCCTLFIHKTLNLVKSNTFVRDSFIATNGKLHAIEAMVSAMAAVILTWTSMPSAAAAWSMFSITKLMCINKACCKLQKCTRQAYHSGRCWLL